MFQPKTFSELCQAMQTRAVVTLNNAYTGVINAIQAEDGSGRNWNVTLSTSNPNKSVTVFFAEKKTRN